MPAKGDHEARRRDVSQAVWQVLAVKGFGGLTLRAVAAQMGASTGLLTHYFPSKHALIQHAFEIAQEHSTARPRQKTVERGVEALRAALLFVLPLDDEITEMNRVWVSFWDAALADPALANLERQRYDRWRGILRPLVDDAIELGELSGDPDDIVVTAAAFGHGLVVQALFDQQRFPPTRQVSLVDGFIDGLRRR